MKLWSVEFVNKLMNIKEVCHTSWGCRGFRTGRRSGGHCSYLIFLFPECKRVISLHLLSCYPRVITWGWGGGGNRSLSLLHWSAVYLTCAPCCDRCKNHYGSLYGVVRSLKGERKFAAERCLLYPVIWSSQSRSIGFIAQACAELLWMVVMLWWACTWCFALLPCGFAWLW